MFICEKCNELFHNDGEFTDHPCVANKYKRLAEAKAEAKKSQSLSDSNPESY